MNILLLFLLFCKRSESGAGQYEFAQVSGKTDTDIDADNQAML